MKFDAKTEQKKFWSIFEEKLIENGEPFSILHEKSGEVTYWATVNNRNTLTDYCLSIDFLVRERKIRINIYVRNDLPFFSFIEKHKQEIESRISVPVVWVTGTTNPNTRRIIYEVPVEIGNPVNYAETIDEILPVIMEMKSVCEDYGKHIFFSF